MTPRDFAYWIQGYFEILNPSRDQSVTLTPDQLECIRVHLGYVFDGLKVPPPATTVFDQQRYLHDLTATGGGVKVC
jgi:hypothetical protein